MDSAKAQHTSGPWKVGGDGQRIWVEPPDPKENVICDIFERTLGSVSQEDEANAALIAAAPEMYEALKRLTLLIFNMRELYSLQAAEWLQNQSSYRYAVAAIAKAEGRQ